MKPTYKYFLYFALLCMVITLGMLVMGYRTEVGPVLIFFLLALAVGFRGHSLFKGFTFTILIFAAVTASLFLREDPARPVSLTSVSPLVQVRATAPSSTEAAVPRQLANE